MIYAIDTEELQHRYSVKRAICTTQTLNEWNDTPALHLTAIKQYPEEQYLLYVYI